MSEELQMITYNQIIDRLNYTEDQRRTQSVQYFVLSESRKKCVFISFW